MLEKYRISLDWMTITMLPIDSRLDEEGNELPAGRYADRYFKRNWSDKAERFCFDLCEKIGFESISESNIKKIRKLGYNIEYNLADGIILGYHDNNEYMGLCLQLSGDGLRSLRLNYDENAEVILLNLIKEFVEERNYRFRVTRLDVAIDVENCWESVYNYKQLLIDEPNGAKAKGFVYRLMAGKNGAPSKYQKLKFEGGGVFNENSYSVYVGSINSDIRLNIYDKMREQKLEPTSELKSWVRFEGRFKRSYATQIANQIINISDEQNVSKFLYRVMIEKFQFRLTEDKIYRMSKNWERLAQTDEVLLRADDSRVSTLQSSYEHITMRSGLFSLLAKAELIFKNKEDNEKIESTEMIDAYFESLKAEYKRYREKEITDDVANFVRDNKNEKIENLPWKIFLKRNIKK